MLLAREVNVTTASYRVGYESSAQFVRDYKSLRKAGAEAQSIRQPLRRRKETPDKKSGRRFADRFLSIHHNNAPSTGTRTETGTGASARTGTGSAGTARTAAGTTAPRRRRTMSPMMAARQKRGGAQSRGGRESEEKASRFLHLRLLLKIVRKSAPAAKRIATGASLSCIFSKER